MAREREATRRQLEEARRCEVCFDADRNIAFECGHSPCSDCAERLQTCHICRGPITERNYITN